MLPTSDADARRRHEVLDDDAVLEHGDLGVPRALVRRLGADLVAHHHHPLDGLAAGQELGLAQDRRTAPTRITAVTTALTLGLQPGRSADALDLAVVLVFVLRLARAAGALVDDGVRRIVGRRAVLVVRRRSPTCGGDGDGDGGCRAPPPPDSSSLPSSSESSSESSALAVRLSVVRVIAVAVLLAATSTTPAATAAPTSVAGRSAWSSSESAIGFVVGIVVDRRRQSSSASASASYGGLELPGCGATNSGMYSARSTGRSPASVLDSGSAPARPFLGRRSAGRCERPRPVDPAAASAGWSATTSAGRPTPRRPPSAASGWVLGSLGLFGYVFSGCIVGHEFSSSPRARPVDAATRGLRCWPGTGSTRACMVSLRAVHFQNPPGAWLNDGRTVGAAPQVSDGRARLSLHSGVRPWCTSRLPAASIPYHRSSIGPSCERLGYYARGTRARSRGRPTPANPSRARGCPG